MNKDDSKEQTVLDIWDGLGIPLDKQMEHSLVKLRVQKKMIKETLRDIELLKNKIKK